LEVPKRKKILNMQILKKRRKESKYKNIYKELHCLAVSCLARRLTSIMKQVRIHEYDFNYAYTHTYTYKYKKASYFPSPTDFRTRAARRYAILTNGIYGLLSTWATILSESKIVVRSNVQVLLLFSREPKFKITIK
jgi:hypothetical protein